MQGMRQTEPHVFTSSQKAGGTDLSAGFSMAKGVEDARHESMTDAVKSARRLCLAMYARHSSGIGVIPSGSGVERSWGSCSTE